MTKTTKRYLNFYIFYIFHNKISIINNAAFKMKGKDSPGNRFQIAYYKGVYDIVFIVNRANY